MPEGASTRTELVSETETGTGTGTGMHAVKGLRADGPPSVTTVLSCFRCSLNVNVPGTVVDVMMIARAVYGGIEWDEAPGS
jgi:hypothetical protein